MGIVSSITSPIARSIVGRVTDTPAGGAPSQLMAIERGPEDKIKVYSQLGGTSYVCAVLDGGPSGRLSWRRTNFCASLRKIYPVNELTLSGSWAQYQSSGSGANVSYVGNRVIAASAANAEAEAEVSGTDEYSVYVAYTGRTTGAYCRVDIDGSQDLVNEIDDPASLGFKAFSTVTAVNLSFRQYKKVASGLTGSHTVKVSFGGNDAGGALMIEAIAVDAVISDEKIAPPQWQPSTAYTQGDEVQHNGTYYVARANATSDSGSGPTHTSGVASDGTMDWNASYKTTYNEWVTIDYASEREYAAYAKITAGGEIGGQTHGNETLVSRGIKVDGAAWSETGEFHVVTTGKRITIDESVTWVHANDSTMASATLLRAYQNGAFKHELSVEITTATVDLGWLYPAMMPMVSWDGESNKRVFSTIETDSGTVIDLDNHSGGVATDINAGEALQITANATVDGVSFSYVAKTDRATMAGFDNANSRCFVRPNINGASAAGGTDWQVKGYFARAVDASNVETFFDGDLLQLNSEHRFRLSA